MSISIDSMSINGKDPKQKSNANFDKRWWLANNKELYQSVQQVFSQITQYDSKRLNQYQLSARLYGNVSLVGAGGVGLGKMQSPNQSAAKERLSYNLVQSVIDTLVSKTSKNKPKPMFLTSGGDWKMQSKAKKLEKFVDGVFYGNNSVSLDDETDRDSFVFGDGIQHIYVQNDEIKYERVLPSELVVDQVEGFYGKPRQLHRYKNIDRMVLVDMFPAKKSLIQSCNSASEIINSSIPNVSDEVTVLESWRLPSGVDAKDGLHTITINNGELITEPYTKDYFPFVRLSWCKRLYGYWAQGLAEQLSPIQLEMNKLLWVIQRSMHMAGSFKVLIENGSKIVSEHLTNDIGAIINYSGHPPQYVTPPIIQREYFEQFENLKKLGFEQAGLSMLSANSQKPAGLDSGIALRTFNDIESERYLFFGHEKERFVMAKTNITIDLAKDIYEKNKHKKSITTKYVGKSFIETIEWKDVAMDKDEYILKTYPISSLPQDPPGRLKFIQEQAQAGLLSPRTAKRLLDFPDLEQIEELENAEEDYLHKILEEICDDGKYTPPDNFDDPALARELCLQYIAKGKLHNLEPEKIELLSTFLDQLDSLIQKATVPPAPATQQIPQASPQPTPTSDMVQNVPGGS